MGWFDVIGYGLQFALQISSFFIGKSNASDATKAAFVKLVDSAKADGLLPSHQKQDFEEMDQELKDQFKKDGK